MFQVRPSIDLIVYINMAKHVQRYYGTVEIKLIKDSLKIILKRLVWLGLKTYF